MERKRGNSEKKKREEVKWDFGSSGDQTKIKKQAENNEMKISNLQKAKVELGNGSGVNQKTLDDDDFDDFGLGENES